MAKASTTQASAPPPIQNAVLEPLDGGTPETRAALDRVSQARFSPIWQSWFIAFANTLAAVGKWINWTPTVVATGAMTVGALTIKDAQYIRVGAYCQFKGFLQFTLGGVSSNEVRITPPFNAVGQTTQVQASALLAGGTAWVLTWSILYGDVLPNVIGLGLQGANFPLGVTQVLFSGSYRVT